MEGGCRWRAAGTGYDTGIETGDEPVTAGRIRKAPFGRDEGMRCALFRMDPAWPVSIVKFMVPVAVNQSRVGLNCSATLVEGRFPGKSKKRSAQSPV